MFRSLISNPYSINQGVRDCTCDLAASCIGPCQPLRTTLLCAGNLLAPIAVAVAEQGMLAVWTRRKAAQEREKLRVLREQVRAARRGAFKALEQVHDILRHAAYVTSVLAGSLACMLFGAHKLFAWPSQAKVTCVCCM